MSHNEPFYIYDVIQEMVIVKVIFQECFFLSPSCHIKKTTVKYQNTASRADLVHNLVKF